WSETGGPPAARPTSQGYGTRVIAASIERQLGGRVSFDWRTSGLACSLTIPRSGKIEAGVVTERARSQNAEDGGGPAKLVRGNRVLIAEDEPLVAMMMSDALAELGFA